MKKLTIYTFEGAPNLLVRSATNTKVSFRFNDKGLLELIEGNPYIEKFKRRFESTKKTYELKEIESDVVIYPQIIVKPDFKNMVMRDLKAYAKDNQVKGYSNLNQQELIKLLEGE